MQKFDYRYPRFAVDFPVRYRAENGTQSGRCTEISEEGMKLELPEPLVSDTAGRVSLTFQDRVLEFNVRVAHGGGQHGGLEFIYESRHERAVVTQLVASLTASPTQSGPVLLKRV